MWCVCLRLVLLIDVLLIDVLLRQIPKSPSRFRQIPTRSSIWTSTAVVVAMAKAKTKPDKHASFLYFWMGIVWPIHFVGKFISCVPKKIICVDEPFVWSMSHCKPYCCDRWVWFFDWIDALLKCSCPLLIQ